MLRMATLRGLQHVIFGQFPEAIVRPFVFAVLIVVAYFIVGDHYSHYHVMAIQVFATMVAFLFGTRWLLRKFPPPARLASASFQTRQWIVNALPFFLMDGMRMFNTQIDTVMLGQFGSLEEVGVYRVIANGAQLVMIFRLAVGSALGPLVAKLYSTGDIKGIQAHVRSTTLAAFAISLPVALLLIFAGGAILKLVFGDAFTMGATGLAILSIGQLVNIAMGPVPLILNMTGFERVSLMGLAINASSNIYLNYLLIPKFGVPGAALATTVSIILSNLMLVVIAKRRLGIDTTVLARS